ncbi:MAG: tRNA pseudouridine(55) synthase TruB [Clostridiales bacterium]|jgi:tRNA pseudouridine55 synthase|nr:tRNA pseudouridine(55) synthase TruB [Clostridiales bacterium]
MHDGVLNIYKQVGFSSNDVVRIVRRLAGSKAGHTGTLDPGACGVLPICLGRATKIADYIVAGEKEYIAEVILGSATDTQDSHGKIVAKSPKRVTEAEIAAVLPHFTGNLMQIPPMYSALKIKGKKLYEYAREGVEIERKAREIGIFGIEPLLWKSEAEPQSFVIRVNCTKGTYIRTLCADIGEALGTFAHMGRLLRSRSGNFAVADSLSIAALESFAAGGRIGEVLRPIEAVLGHMPKIRINREGHKALINGNKVDLEFVENPEDLSNSPMLTYSHENRLVGIFHIVGNFLRPKTML